MSTRSRIFAWAALCALALTTAAGAQSGVPRVRDATLCRNQDITTAGYTYFAYGDSNPSTAGLPVNGVWLDGRQKSSGNIKAKTTGSTTAVVSFTASAAAFDLNAVGDLLIFTRVIPPLAASGLQNADPVRFERKITAKADNDNITVDEAIDLSSGGGFDFRYKKLFSGTAITDGWFPVKGIGTFTLQSDVNTINATSLTVGLECRASPFAQAYPVYSKTFTTTGPDSVTVSSPQGQCRIGWKIVGDTGVQSVSTYIVSTIQ